MLRLLEVGVGMGGLVSAAADVAADEAEPQVRRLAADGAGGGLVGGLPTRRLDAAADGAARVAPLAQALGVEGVVAKDGEDAVHGLLHALEADGAGGELGGALHAPHAALLHRLHLGHVHEVAGARLQRVERNAVVAPVKAVR